MQKEFFRKKIYYGIYPKLALMLVSVILLFSIALSFSGKYIAMQNLYEKIDRQEERLLKQYADYIDETILKPVRDMSMSVLMDMTFSRVISSMDESKYSSVDMYNFLKSCRKPNSPSSEIVVYIRSKNMCISTSYGLKFLDTQNYALERYDWIDTFRNQPKNNIWYVQNNFLHYTSTYPFSEASEESDVLLSVSISMNVILDEIASISSDSVLSIIDPSGKEYSLPQTVLPEDKSCVVTECPLKNQLILRKTTSIKSMYDAAYRMQHQMVIAGSVFTCIGVIFAFFLSYRMYKPLRHLTRDAEMCLDICGEPTFAANELRIINHSIVCMRNHIQRLNTMIGSSMSALRSDLAIKLLSGVLDDGSIIIDKLAEVGIPYCFTGYTVILVLFHDRSDVSNSNLISETGRLSFQQGHVLAAMKNPVEMAVVLMCTDQGYDEFVDNVISEIRACSSSVLFAVGTWVDSILNLSVSHRRAEHALKYKFIEPKTDILYAWKFEKYIHENTDRWNVSVSRLERALKSNNEEEAQSSLKDIHESFQKSMFDYETHIAVLHLLIDVIKKFDMQTENDTPFSEKIQSAASFEDALAGISLAVDGLIEIQRNSLLKRTERIIDCVKSYIHAHISESPRIHEISEAIGLSASHISHLFKTVTGISVVDYIIKIKMCEVENLLKNTNLQISEIAQKYGYTSPQYLAKQFKDTYGLSPKDYRLRIRNSGKVTEAEEES